MTTRVHDGISNSHWRILSAAFACVALFGLVSCSGGSSSSPASASHLAYVAGGQTNVVGLRINSSGAFQTILGSPFVAGRGPSSVMVHPSNKFLFVANQGEGTISLFTIDPTSGALTEVLPRTTAGISPVAMAMDTGGNFLYVANQGANPSILAFSIGPSGALSLVGSPIAIGSSPSGITLSSAGFLYVPVPNFSAIYVFAVNSGALTQVGLPFFVSDGVATLAVDPAGKFLFVPNPSTGTVTVLTIQSDGSLAAGPGAFAASTSPVAATTDLTGKYLYVANFGSTTISQYTIDSTTGALSTFTSTTSTPTAGTNPTFIIHDPNGQFVYVGNQGSSSLTEFTIKSDGSLTSTSNSTTLGVQPRSLAITK